MLVERPPGVDLNGKVKAVFFIGRGRTGKTTLARWAYEGLAERGGMAIIAAADPRSAATAGGVSGSAVTKDQLGHRHAGLELPHQLVGIEFHADRVAIERGRVHPRLPLLGGREVVDL